MDTCEILAVESQLFFGYFCQRKDIYNFENQYNKGIQILKLKLNNQDNDILNFVIKHPKTIKIIDCGLAIFKKQSNLRKRFVLAAAISEATTSSVSFYLNVRTQKYPFFTFLFIGFSTVSTIFLAFLLFKIKSWK
jgi:hypothetical protein